MAQLPKPNFLGNNKPRVVSQRQHDPIHIQIPCSVSIYVNQQWVLVNQEAIIQLLNHPSGAGDGVNKEVIRVLDLQNRPVLFQALTKLKWSKLTEVAYELDILNENRDILDVYAIRFCSGEDTARFNQVFEEINNRKAAGLSPFLQPLADAIRRGDYEDACARFKFLCEFPDRDRKIRIRAEKPLTQEEIEMQKSVQLSIPVENCDGSQCEIMLRVPKDSTIADLKQIMYLKYEIPVEVQKWLDEQSLLKNSEPVLDKVGEPRKIFLYILNAAKVGLNQVEFQANLELSKQNLQKKQLQAQLPIDEEEVPMAQSRRDDFTVDPPQNPYNPMSIPPGPSPMMPSPDTPPTEPVFVEHVIWSCPDLACHHVNAWENSKCEKCRRDRPIGPPN